MSAGDPPPISLGSNGDIDMYPGPTTRALDGIQRPIDGWAGLWPGTLSAIHAEEAAAQTGFDDISVAFRTSYNNVEPELSAQVTAFAPRLLGAVATGRSIVADYVEAFAQAADALRVR